MDITEIQLVKDWLNQFEKPDAYLAEYMLKKIRYISLEEYEEWMQTATRSLLQEIEKTDRIKKSVAIFPVTKNTQNVFNQNKELKEANDSSGRLGHVLKNIERDLGKHIELSPRIKSMRARKVKHIVFIDDFTGTGKRFIDFWAGVNQKSIKSWCSFGWCKIWFLSFIAHEEGINRITSKINHVKLENIRVGNKINKSFISQNNNLRSLCEKYGKRIHKDDSGFGFGGLLSPFVFQYGCPNNAPTILWLKGNKKSVFKPLFPNRSVPTELFPLFKARISIEETAEDLWIANNYQLAVNFLNNTDLYKGRYELLTILSYIKSGKSLEFIRGNLVMSASEITKLFEELKGYGLTDEHFLITRFGLEVLSRGKKVKLKNVRGKREYKNFYPATFLGFQREV